jgi:hypothetical protein
MPFDPNSPFAPAGADGIDDWFVPGQSPGRIAPWTPQTDHLFPDDWFSPDNRNAPKPAAASSTAPPQPSPQPNAINPALSNRRAPRPDPFAAYWALIPASRLTAVAWAPPILPNSLGQYPLPAPAPTNISPDATAGGLLGGIPKMLPAQASEPAAYGLLGGIPKMLAAQAAANDPWNGLLGGTAKLPYTPPDVPTNVAAYGLLGGRSWLPQSSPDSAGFRFPPQQQSASAQPFWPTDPSGWSPAPSSAFSPGNLSRLESSSPDPGSLPPPPQSASAPAVSPLGRSPTGDYSTGEIAGDVAKSFGVGMGRFGIQAAGLPGDAREMLASGAQHVADYLAPGSAPNAVSKVSEFLASYPLLTGPTSSQLQSAVESYTGPFYQPKTIYGDYAQTAGEFVPGALLMPEGSLATNALRYGLLPALSSETAGQLTKGTAVEPWARTFGAILGAAPGALRGLPWARSVPDAGLTIEQELAALSERAGQIHGALDKIAQSRRVTAILSTDGDTIVAGGKRDLDPVQRALIQPGERAAKLPGAHAEITALSEAENAGLMPRALATSRPICPECRAAIEDADGVLTSKFTAVFPH